MKILNIYFKNINSLEGESRIHFDQPPIADGGVFAITGPNGSGKSSILDVITLGLYGETYRFDRPAAHVMTKATVESFAQVEFAIGADIFRSSWHVKRENNNSTAALLPSEMKLVQLNGSEQLLEESGSKVRNRMAELTGMDFHKFSKSMVLAQGDFAAFLNALDSERLDILEKISGTDIYSDYKQQVEEKNTQAQTLLQQLEQDLNAIPVMDTVTREAREQDLEDFKQQALELENAEEQVQQQINWLQNLSDLENQTESLHNQRLQVENQLQESQQKLEQIESSQGSMIFAEELKQIDRQSEAVNESRKTLDSYRNELEILQKQLASSNFDEAAQVSSETLSEQKNTIDQEKLKLNELKSELPQEKTLLQSLNQQTEEKKANLAITETWLQEQAVDKSLLENFPQTEKLREIRNELADLAEKQNVYIKRSKRTAEDVKNNKSTLSALNAKTNDLKAQINADEKSITGFSEGYSLQNLQGMETEQEERVNKFRELFELAGVNVKLAKKGFFGQLFAAKKADNKEEKQLAAESEQLQMKIAKEKNIVQTLERAVFNEQLLQKMQADRPNLQENKACPLCGALHHPYVEHPPAISNSTQALRDQQKKLKELNLDANGLSNKIVKAQKQAEIDGKKDSQLQINFSQWNSLANKLNVAGIDLDINNLSLMKHLLNKEKQELSHLGHLIKKYSNRQSSIFEAQSSIEANQVTINRVTLELEGLERESKTGPTKVTEDIQLAYVKCQTKEKVLAATVKEQLALLAEEMPIDKDKADVLIEQLKVRRQEYQSQAVRHKALIEELQTLEGKSSVSSSKIDGINTDIGQSSELLQQQEGLGLHLALIEKQKLIVDKELVFSKQETELASASQVLIDKTKDTLGGSLSELRDQITLLEEQPEIEQKQMQLSQSMESIKDKLQQAQADLELEQAKNSTTKSVEELVALQKSSQEKLDIVKQEKEAIENKLNRQSDLFEKHEQILAKVESQKVIADVCSDEMKLVNDENSLDFRDKVQQIIADKLLSQSNQILEKLSGRYYVRKVDSDNGLGIEIEDTKQNNARRLPKTLSGGESFIVSLALALGLAEMANNGKAVDSLFLDEGFGTLDAESLYLAMTTLENLKTHGKVVGVISHVEGVRKRIKTQIEMVKKPNGLSGLKIVS